MRINAAQLTRQLNQTLPLCTLISGSDLFLMDESRALILDKAKQNGFEQSIRFTPTAASHWPEICQEASARSLFDDKKIILIDLKKASLDKATLAYFTQLLATLDESVCLIICCPKLTQAQAKSAWLNAIDKQGLIVTVWPIEPQQLASWCKQRLSQYGFTCSPDGLELMVSYLEGNLAAITQEIEKLRLQFKPGPLSEQTLQQSLSKQANFDVFQWTDTLLLGNLPRSMKILQALQADGSEPILLLWAIARDIRSLAKVSFLVEQGQPIESAMQSCGVWQKRKPLFKRALKGRTPMFFYQCLSDCAKIDSIIKGLEKGEAWTELSSLNLTLCSHRSG